MLLRTGLDNVFLPTLNNVVSNTVQCSCDNAFQDWRFNRNEQCCCNSATKHDNNHVLYGQQGWRTLLQQCIKIMTTNLFFIASTCMHEQSCSEGIFPWVYIAGFLGIFSWNPRCSLHVVPSGRNLRVLCLLHIEHYRQFQDFEILKWDIVYVSVVL